MDRINYLKEQAAKAERLARGVVDAETVERLMAFAAACRAQMSAGTDPRQLPIQRESSPGYPPPSMRTDLSRLIAWTYRKHGPDA
jgi:hypothetical protein